MPLCLLAMVVGCRCNRLRDRARGIHRAVELVPTMAEMARAVELVPAMAGMARAAEELVPATMGMAKAAELVPATAVLPQKPAFRTLEVPALSWLWITPEAWACRQIWTTT